MSHKPNYFFHTDKYLDFFPAQVQIWRGKGAMLCAWPSGKILKSPLQASFGGLDSTNNCTYEAIENIWQKAIQYAYNQGLEKIEVTLPPVCYAPQMLSHQQEILGLLGFRVDYADLNFHWPIVAPTADKFLRKAERWKRNKALREGWRACNVRQTNLHDLYHFILESRLRKGFELSLSEDTFVALLTKFPNEYEVFEVRNEQQELLAAAVTLAVSDEILYIFYTADSLAARRLSPVVLLHTYIYEYAYNQGFKIIDLGTASLHGFINEGVARFKTHLGASRSEKVSMVLELSSEEINFDDGHIITP